MQRDSQSDEENFIHDENVKFAIEAIRYCRNIIPTNKSYTNPIVTEQSYLAALFYKVKEVRANELKISEVLHHTLMYPHSEYLKDVKKTVKKTKQHNIGNCGELSDLAIHFLRKKNIKRAERVSIEDGDHVFVIIDREGDINDSSTWGEACVILDVLMNQVFDPTDIFAKLKCYRFDINRDNPHILRDFTEEDRLIVEGEIRLIVDGEFNEDMLEDFYRKLDIVAKSCVQYLKKEEQTKLVDLIGKLKVKPDNFQYLSNFDLERNLDRKMKQVIKLIESVAPTMQDVIFSEIMTEFLFDSYIHC